MTSVKMVYQTVTIDDLMVTLYGYKTNYWVRMNLQYYSEYYAKVHDDFKLGDVVDYKIRWKDPNYPEKVKQVIIMMKDGSQYESILSWNEEKELPFVNQDVYGAADKLLSIGGAVGIHPGGGNVSYETLVGEYSDTIIRTVEEEHRLLALLKGKDVYELVKTIDKLTTRNQDLDQKLTEVDKVVRTIRDTLDNCTNQIDTLVERNQALIAERDKLLAERADYKTTILAKLSDSIKQL